MPVLGICRGMQLINVATGGTLDQHLPESIGDGRHRSIAGTFGTHQVRLAGARWLRRGWDRRPAGDGRTITKGGAAGEGLEVAAGRSTTTSSRQSSCPDRRFALGVVWHPEEDEPARSSRPWSRRRVEKLSDSESNAPQAADLAARKRAS